MTWQERFDEEFWEMGEPLPMTSKKLLTRDYVKSFISTELSNQLQEIKSEVEQMKSGYSGNEQYRYGKEALQDVLLLIEQKK
jgi:uncharacterized protein YukE